MSRVILGEDGLRYRHEPSRACDRCDFPGSPHHSVSRCQKNVILPTIPGHPLGSVQFLTDDIRTQLYDGDLVVGFDGKIWTAERLTRHNHNSRLYGWVPDTEAGKAWLIRRMHSEADA